MATVTTPRMPAQDTTVVSRQFEGSGSSRRRARCRATRLAITTQSARKTTTTTMTSPASRRVSPSTCVSPITATSSKPSRAKSRLVTRKSA